VNRQGAKDAKFLTTKHTKMRMGQGTGGISPNEFPLGVLCVSVAKNDFYKASCKLQVAGSPFDGVQCSTFNVQRSTINFEF
jgi:hypothetical protein